MGKEESGKQVMRFWGKGGGRGLGEDSKLRVN